VLVLFLVRPHRIFPSTLVPCHERQANSEQVSLEPPQLSDKHLRQQIPSQNLSLLISGIFPLHAYPLPLEKALPLEVSSNLYPFERRKQPSDTFCFLKILNSLLYLTQPGGLILSPLRELSRLLAAHPVLEDTMGIRATSDRMQRK